MTKRLSRRQQERNAARRFAELRADVADQVRSLKRGTLRNPYPKGYPDALLLKANRTSALFGRSI